MLYCVRLCVRFPFLRKIFARKEERMGIQGRTDWEEWKSESRGKKSELGGMEERIGRKGRANREERKNGSGGKEERFGRRGRVPAVVLESTSAGTRKYHLWYFPWYFHVFRRRLHRLPENTTSSAGEHYIVCRRTPIRFSPSDSELIHPLFDSKNGQSGKNLTQKQESYAESYASELIVYQ